jgi:hypothetical protein
MWRSTERASLEKKPSTRLSQEPCLGATGWLGGEKSLGLLRNIRRVIVEDQFDGGVGRIGGVEKLEEFDEFATSSNEQEIKPHKVRYYLERREPEFKQKMAEVLCVYREVKLIKGGCGRRQTGAERCGGDRLL